jgi:hypothetical protein
LNIERDLSVIFKDKEWFNKTLLGGIFFMIPPLFILSFGFIARFIHDRLETGNKALPSWDNWGLLFLKGFEWGLIIVFYFVIPVFILSLLPGSVVQFLVNPKFVISSLKIGGFFILFLSFLLGFIVMFFLPMALILFSDTGSFINAVRFKEIYKHIKNKPAPYLVTYLLTVFLLVLDFLLHLVLNTVQFGLILILAYFLFVWLGFIILLISASLFIESF